QHGIQMEAGRRELVALGEIIEGRFGVRVEADAEVFVSPARREQLAVDLQDEVRREGVARAQGQVDRARVARAVDRHEVRARHLIERGRGEMCSESGWDRRERHPIVRAEGCGRLRSRPDLPPIIRRPKRFVGGPLHGAVAPFDLELSDQGNACSDVPRTYVYRRVELATIIPYI